MTADMSTDDQPKIQQTDGLRYVSHRFTTQKSASTFDNKSVEQSDVADGNAISKQLFFVDDGLKDLFQNEMHAHHFGSDESDEDVVRHFTRQMNNDDPFYIADVSHCAKQYQKWTHYLPNVKPFYAIKTNSNSFIIKVIEKMGGGFDCASIAELDAVLAVCPDIDCSQRIIYAHPCKQISHLIYFRDRGVKLTVADNDNELIKIKDYWSHAQVLIRLKTKDSESLIGFSSKFGASERVAIQMLAVAKTLNLEIIGCAFHVGTGCYDKTAFRHSLELAKRVFDAAKKPEYGVRLSVLDIGGGFPGVDEEGKPTFSEMAEVINQTLHEWFPESEGIHVIAEPGRYFSAASMSLVTSIIGCRSNNKDYFDHPSVEDDRLLDIKTTENAEIFYYINDGIFGPFGNILSEKAKYSVCCLHKYDGNPPQSDEKEYQVAVFGPTLDSTDCLSSGVNLPLLKMGDYLWFYHIGSYSDGAATNFTGFKTKKYFFMWRD